MGRFTQDGVVYEEVGNGQVRVVGYEDAPAVPSPNGGPGVRVGTPREQPVPSGFQRNPDGSVTYIPGGPADPSVIARNSAAGRAPERTPQPSIPAGYRFNQSGNLEPIPGGPADPANANRANSGDQRIANLRALERQIADVRGQYEQNFRGGAPNALVGMLPNIIRPENGQFDSAGQGMADTGNAAFRVPGSGTTSDADAARFVAANTPQSGDSDQVIEQKLRNLSTRLDETYRAMGLGPGGVPIGQQQAPQRNDGPAAAAIPMGGAGSPPSGPAGPFGGNGPNMLPTARGAHGDAGIGANGVVDAASGGMRVVPELYGLGSEIAGLVQNGASREQVLAHYQERMAGAGMTPNAGQVAMINEIIGKHQQFPSAPVTSLADGWANFHMQQQADNGGSMLGRVADTAPGAALIGAANGVSAGNLGNIAGDQAQSVVDYSQAERPGSTFVGDALGTTGMMMAGGGAASALGRSAGMMGRVGRGLTAFNGVGADALYGGIRGASEADPGNRLAGAFMGAGVGALGNVAGQGVVGGAGRVVRGVTDPSVRYLSDRGINMSMGQLLGNRSIPGRVFNKLESIPVVGDLMGARRASSVGDYGRAQLAENLAPIGYQPPAGPYSQDMLTHAQNAVGDSYNFLNGRNFSTDTQGVADIGSALNAGRTVPRVGDEFSAVVDRNIGPLFDQSGNFTGQGYQDAMQQLRSAGAAFSQDGAMGNMASDATSQLQDAIDGIVARQAPDVAPQMQAANAAYRGLVPIENASISSTNNAGMFTPAQYGRAAVNNTRRFGGRGAAARGDVPGGELQRHAQDIIPSTIPDSGTAGRLLAMALPTALGGTAAGAGTFTDHPIAAASLGALALLSTRGGSRAVQRAMMGGARRQRLGQSLLNNQGVAGLLGSSLLLPAYSASGQ